jgi:hypothetical protein
LKNLAKQIASHKAEDERREAEISKVLVEAKKLVSAIEERGIKTGMAQYKEVMGLRKPYLDRDNIIHWPVLLLYPQVMSTDFVEDFCETDMLASHLDIMFSDSCLPLSWDKENAYTRDAIELYYERNAGNCAYKTDLTKYLLEGTAASHLTIDDNDQDEAGFKPEAKSGDRWVKVNEKRTLYDVLKEPDFIIPMIPVFYVVIWDIYPDPTYPRVTRGAVTTYRAFNIRASPKDGRCLETEPPLGIHLALSNHLCQDQSSRDIWQRFIGHGGTTDRTSPRL